MSHEVVASDEDVTTEDGDYFLPKPEKPTDIPKCHYSSRDSGDEEMLTGPSENIFGDRTTPVWERAVLDEMVGRGM